MGFTKSPTQTPARRREAEHCEQTALIGWCEWQGKKLHPELDLIYAIPNGGKRGKVQAAKMKMEGVRSGIPDLHLPVSRQGFHGLYIEMKSKIGKAEPHQLAMHERLRAQGNRVEVCKGFESAKAVLLNYFGDNPDSFDLE